MEMKIGIQKEHNKPIFCEVPLGGLFTFDDVLCIKISDSLDKDNYICVATSDAYKSIYVGVTDNCAPDEEIDEIITNAKIVW